MAKIFYPPCEHLDIYNRDAQGRMFCIIRQCYVEPKLSVLRTVSWKRSMFMREWCARDCWHRRGKTIVNRDDGGLR